VTEVALRHFRRRGQRFASAASTNGTEMTSPMRARPAKSIRSRQVQLTDNGALFKAVVFTSSPRNFQQRDQQRAMLTVVPDTTPPVLGERVGSVPLFSSIQQTRRKVYVVFSEGVRIDTATTWPITRSPAANGSLGLSNATLLAGSTTVALTTGPQAAGTLYTWRSTASWTWRRPRTWWPPTARRRSRRRIF